MSKGRRNDQNMKRFNGFGKKKSLPTFQSLIKFEENRIEEKYRTLGLMFPNVVWNAQHIKGFKVEQFRGDNIYVWQTRKYSEINYLISYKYAVEIDKLKLLEKLSEAGDFGVQSFDFYGRKVSRDLIDSVLEINYLNTFFDFEKRRNFHVLDIGAGYGRFANRIVEALPKVKVTCIDAIPLSTSISKFYIKELVKNGSAQIVDLSETDTIIENSLDLAVNIHSFSEMPIEAVKFWVDLLVAKNVKYVFIVPNTSTLSLNDGTDFSYLFSAAGYKVLKSGNKFDDVEVNRFGIYPSTYFLLERQV